MTNAYTFAIISLASTALLAHPCSDDVPIAVTSDSQTAELEQFLNSLSKVPVNLWRTVLS